MTYGASTVAAQWVCAKDLNSDGNVAGAGETLACDVGPEGPLCPFDKAVCSPNNPVCPLGNALPCDANNTCTELGTCTTPTPTGNPTCPLNPKVGCDQNNQCTNKGACLQLGWFLPIYRCSLDGTTHWSLNTCNLACTQTAACTPPPMSPSVCSLDGTSHPDYATCDAACKNTATCPPAGGNGTCPFNPNAACITDPTTSTPSCSQIECIDLDATPPISANDGSTMQQNDGATDPTTGACLDDMVFFPGRGMRCLEAGIENAYKNCCARENGDIADSRGSATDAYVQGYIIGAAFDAAAVAYAAYNAAIATGATASAAAGSAASAVGQWAAQAGPAALYVAAAIMVYSYLTMECDSQSMEVGNLRGAGTGQDGYCHFIGNYCKQSWPVFGCVQKAKRYCCFNSQMAMLIQEGAREQLPSKTWGSVDTPDCTGISPEEFAALDFSLIDFGDYVDQFAIDQGAIQQNNADSMQQSLDDLNVTR
jgi:hypothetical protein